jgi:hydrogenase nickel incorporation protein HypB
LKYPVMFRAADVIVVNKIDLLPHLDFDLDAFLESARGKPLCRDHHGQCSYRQRRRQWCDWLTHDGTKTRGP